MEDPLRLRVEAHTLYVTQMLARLGFDPNALDAHPQRDDLRMRCRSCGAIEECARWLKGRAQGGREVIPNFCPNREHIAILPRFHEV